MSEPKLTRKDEVLSAVAMGAKIEKVDARGGLLRLVCDGREIPAWLTALKSAARALEQQL
jgi:hypothetical protein